MTEATRNFRKQGPEPTKPVRPPEKPQQTRVSGGLSASPATQSQGEAEVQLIRKKLKHYTAEKPPEHWLNTGNAYLHQVLGDPMKGVPYGGMISISGWESEGKSCLGMDILALAQKVDNAAVGLIDIERAYRKEWAALRGIDTDRLAVFQTELVIASKKKKDEKVKDEVPVGDEGAEPKEVKYELLSAEQLFAEAEAWVEMKSKTCDRIVLLVDSTTALLPREAIEKGLEGGARRALLAAFLSRMLPYWLGICGARNVMMILINQMREDPGVMFGDPEYEPGGNALRFYPSIQVRIKRSTKGGAIIQNGKRIGIRGTLTNRKNKVGGLEWSKVGYKVYFSKPSVFLDAKDVVD